MATKIPGLARQVLHLSFGADTDDVLEISLGQSEARLRRWIGDDKIRAVKAIATDIHRKKTSIEKAKGQTKRLLKKELAVLEERQFQILRNEILNYCKDFAGLIDEKKLAKIPGSQVYFREKSRSKR